MRQRVSRNHRKGTYDRRGKGTVQPTATLTDELRSRLRYVGLCLTRLDVRQRPLIVRLRDQLETQDTILSQEHVLRKDVHAVDTLRAETVSQRMVSMEVLLQWPSKDSTESVC